MRSFRSSVFLPARHSTSGFTCSHVLRPARRSQQTASASRLVRVRRPWFSRMRFVKWASYGTVTYLSLRFLRNKLLDGVEFEYEEVQPDKQDDAKKSDSGKDNEEERDTDLFDHPDATFLPLQFPKKLPKRYYKSSDFEWQVFSVLSRDVQRQTEVRDMIASSLAKHASTMPSFQQNLGKDIKSSKCWLDFSYPDGPPPEYTRRGVTIDDDGWALSQQFIPHARFVEIQSLMWPQAFFTASKSSLEVFWNLQSIRVKSGVGVELNPREKQLQHATKVYTTRRNAFLKRQEHAETKDRLERDEADKLHAANTADPQGVLETLLGVLEGAQRTLLSIRPPRIPVATDFSISSRVFAEAFTQSWGRAKSDPQPPGCCFVTGNVELVGSRARVKLSVSACYDPFENKCVWIHSKPVQFLNNVQVAKGGP